MIPGRKYHGIHGIFDGDESCTWLISVKSVSTEAEETGSTIAPPPNQRLFLTNVAWLLDTRTDAMKKISSRIFLFAKDY